MTKTYKISEIGDLKNGLNFNRSQFGQGIGVVNVKQLYDGRYVKLENLETIKRENINNLSSYLLQEGDILFTRSSVMRSGSGKSALVPKLSKDTSFSGFVIRLRINDKKKFDPLFLIYVLATPKYRKLFQQISTGTSISNVSQDLINSVELIIPDIKIQKKITNLIGTLDDKIELNQKKIRNLYSTASKLFINWFVDFDFMNLKSLNHLNIPKNIKELFPKKNDDTIKGEVPYGWDFVQFGSIVEPKRGKIISQKITNPGDIPVIGGGLKPSYYHDLPNVDGPVITISGSGANAGFVNIYYSDVWASDCSYISKQECEFFYTSYLFLKFKQKEIFFSQHGAVQPHINPNDIKKLLIPNIPYEILNFFEKNIETIFSKIIFCNNEIKILKKIRGNLIERIFSDEKFKLQ